MMKRHEANKKSVMQKLEKIRTREVLRKRRAEEKHLALVRKAEKQASEQRAHRNQMNLVKKQSVEIVRSKSSTLRKKIKQVIDDGTVRTKRKYIRNQATKIKDGLTINAFVPVENRGDFLIKLLACRPAEIKILPVEVLEVERTEDMVAYRNKYPPIKGNHKLTVRFV